jgi:hypothetical protein
LPDVEIGFDNLVSFMFMLSWMNNKILSLAIAERGGANGGVGGGGGANGGR